MNRKGMILGVLVLVLVLSTGCGQKPGASPEAGAGNAGTNQGSGVTDPQVTDPAQGAGNVDKPDQQSASIEVYFTDEQMLDLTKVSREITFQADEDKYLEALKALQDSSDSQLLPLWGKAEFHKAELKGEILTVDLSLPDEARLGAGGEALALDALRNTLFQFSEVEAIELLVDGQQVDTLMGHVELEHPITRN
ncbi:GerMN domain-containing protein [Paenibacillus senegalimassiliensis]|uniref:GerMN domain-containing protein n=1 Tax=Paenibacillus senegalimassiliensis TaxID=1737426 RepID=UPI00073E5F7D|nr:GerMN domain-containing protein [Paenibacillus senegalimassiliensis]